MTLIEIEKNILNIAKGGGLASDDTRLNGRLIRYWIRYYRAALIPKYTNFGKDIAPEMIQDLGVVTLTDIDKSEDSSIPVGCHIKKATIPLVVDMPQDRGLVFVGVADKQEPFLQTRAEDIYFKRHMRLTSDMPRFYHIGTTLYVVHKDPMLRYVNVRGVFEDPTAVPIPDGNGGTRKFDIYNDPYPIHEAMVSEVVQNIMLKELNMSMKTSFDLENDALDASQDITAKRYSFKG